MLTSTSWTFACGHRFCQLSDKSFKSTLQTPIASDAEKNTNEKLCYDNCPACSREIRIDESLLSTRLYIHELQAQQKEICQEMAQAGFIRKNKPRRDEIWDMRRRGNAFWGFELQFQETKFFESYNRAGSWRPSTEEDQTFKKHCDIAIGMVGLLQEAQRAISQEDGDGDGDGGDMHLVVPGAEMERARKDVQSGTIEVAEGWKKLDEIWARLVSVMLVEKM
jgi:hypothetical protein